jgi:hypothetical protein
MSSRSTFRRCDSGKMLSELAGRQASSRKALSIMATSLSDQWIDPNTRI